MARILDVNGTIGGKTYLKQGDTRPFFTATLRDELGNAIDVTGATGQIHFWNVFRARKKFSAAITITDAANGLIEYQWAATDLDTRGSFDVEIEITRADTTIETYPSLKYHRVIVGQELNK